MWNKCIISVQACEQAYNIYMWLLDMFMSTLWPLLTGLYCLCDTFNYCDWSQVISDTCICFWVRRFMLCRQESWFIALSPWVSFDNIYWALACPALCLALCVGDIGPVAHTWSSKSRPSPGEEHMHEETGAMGWVVWEQEAVNPARGWETHCF